MLVDRVEGRVQDAITPTAGWNPPDADDELPSAAESSVPSSPCARFSNLPSQTQSEENAEEIEHEGSACETPEGIYIYILQCSFDVQS